METARKRPLKPLVGENENDVYITESKNDSPNVVFKQGKQAALLAEVCYRLSSIAGLEGAVVPAKRGIAHVIDSKTAEEDHPLMKVIGASEEDMQEVVVTMKKTTPVTISWKGKVLNHIACKIYGKEFVLERQPSGGYKVCEIMNSLDSLVKAKTRVKVCSTGEDKKDYFVVEADQVYDIAEKGGKEYIKIGSLVYKLVEKEDKIHLERIGTPQNSDPEIAKTPFLRVDILDPSSPEEPFEVLVPSSGALPIKLAFEEMELDENDTSIVFSFQGSQYRITVDEEVEGDVFTFSIEKEDADENEPDKRLATVINHVFTLVATDVPQQPKTYVLAPRSAILSKEVEGMVQMKVENTFHTPKNGRFPLDMRSESPALEDFFNNIEPFSFIECFIATILLRPQDGKITNLGQSNVLFQEIPDSPPIPNNIGITHRLRPVIIDNDETMPPNNTVSTTIDEKQMRPKKSYLKDPNNVVHPVRNGLMGFPQATRPLTPDEKTYAVKVIRNIIDHKNDMKKYLESVSKKEKTSGSKLFNEDKVTACIEIVDSLEAFLKKNQKNDWSLQDLFFAVFPEYKVHWDAITNESPASKASLVGLYSLKSLRDYKR